MERLLKIGKVPVKSSAEVAESRLGIGFEKLDRALFDPSKAYDKIAAIGVKWIRLQSGWMRTEQEPGVYSFAWLDEIVDNLRARGMRPWITLCYGNPLYTDRAKTSFGAVGCPPIQTETAREGWANYVRATAKHFAGRVEWYEVWNEPDGSFSWKHDLAEGETEPGPNAAEYTAFTADTARAVREGDPSAKVIGMSLSNKMDFFYACLRHGIADHVDALSYHSYRSDETSHTNAGALCRTMMDDFAPSLPLIQGESGAQSSSRGAGAMHGFAWTPARQTKWLLRNLIPDLAADVMFTSYFSSLDMVEALRGTVGDKQSYLDYGYFGVLGADFDEDGIASGEYTPKPSYYALQTLASLFAGDPKPENLPVLRRMEPSRRVNGNDLTGPSLKTYGFRLDDGTRVLTYWNSVPLLTTTYEGTISFEVFGLPTEHLTLTDLATGDVYALPATMLEKRAEGDVVLVNLPVTDSPLMLSFR